MTRKDHPILLDISRTISRLGAGFDTGIDRVERAYGLEFLERFTAPLFLAKIGKRFALLDRVGLKKLYSYERSSDWPKTKGLNRFRFKLSPHQRRLRTLVESLAIESVDAGSLAKALSKYVTKDWSYFNVGHTNLSERFLSEIKTAGCSEINVMVHDMIPLDHPEYTRDRTVEIFEKRMKAVATKADRVICNSHATKDRVLFWFEKFGRLPDIIVAHLGIDLAAQTNSETQDAGPAIFSTIGTIEARKNHDLLLTVWEELAQRSANTEMPHLVLAGKRGWKNEAFFARLEKSPLFGKSVFEKSDLNDSEIESLLAQSHALLFPSFVEGYGLPAKEAELSGCPVVCSDLPVFREILRSNVSFLDPYSPDDWVEEIEERAKLSRTDARKLLGEKITENDGWKTHFSLLFGTKRNSL